jgi:hypothetical protein
MSISTYSELQAAVAGWLHRDDLTLLIPDFIRLAEARLSRKLRTRAMLTDFPTVALVSGAASLPSGFRAFKELRYDGSPGYTLEARPLEWIRSQSDNAGRPLYFAVTSTQVICWPQSGSIRGTYYTEIPALASNSTNWLLTAHPDLYLFAALTESALYTQDDTRVPFWAEKAKALIEEVQGEDNANSVNGGPLTARVR